MDGWIEQIFQGDGVALRTFPVAFNTTDYYGYIYIKSTNYSDYPQFLGYGSRATNQAQLYRAFHDGSGQGHYNVAIASNFWVKLMGY